MLGAQVPLNCGRPDPEIKFDDDWLHDKHHPSTTDMSPNAQNQQENEQFLFTLSVSG